MEPVDVVPIGYRFTPTDEELVLHYLHNKVAGKPLPGHAVACGDVYATEPWNLLGSGRQEAYFLAERKRKNATGSRVDRRAGTGSWNLYKKEEPITSIVGGRKVVVGRKSSLSFNDGLRKNSGWTMHEYELCTSSGSHDDFQTQVLCHIKKRSLQAVSDSSRSQLKRGRHESTFTETKPAWPLPIDIYGASCWSSKETRLDLHQPQIMPINFVHSNMGVQQWQGDVPAYYGLSMTITNPQMEAYQDPFLAYPGTSTDQSSNLTAVESILSPEDVASAENPEPLPRSTDLGGERQIDTSLDQMSCTDDAITVEELEPFWKSADTQSCCT